MGVTDPLLNNTNGNMINIHGSVVKSFTICNGNERIDTGELRAGIYYLKTLHGSSKILMQ